ncbi:DMT family transporter [Metabacillus sp. RGM 3146]|uniref:DMT family transporter n=1 Tax=Metabacillus sp. RGM 3146 TaxID=3401092 RepID=UPI003B9D6ACB
MNRNHFYPYAALIIGVLSVSASAIFVKLSSSPAPVTAFYRMFLSVLILMPLFLLKSIKEIKLLTKKDWLFTILAGVLLAVHFILWFESLQYTSVASSVVLVTLQPLFAFIGTYFFFKEKLSAGGILSSILTIIGSMIISWGDLKVSGEALFGDMLALAACLMVTAYLLFGQEVRKRHNLTLYSGLVYGISAATLLIYCLLFSYPLVPAERTDWFYFVLLAVFPNLLGHSLFNWALKWISTNTISVAILFEPVGAVILACIFLQEIITLTQIIGGSIIMTGILWFLLGNRPNKQRETAQEASLID